MDYSAPPHRIYKYCSFDTAQLILNTSTLKYSSPTEFNDPFDSIENLIDPSLENINKKIIEAWVRKQRPFLNRTQVRKTVQDYFKNKASFKTQILGAIKGVRSRIGVCCFSKRYKNQLLWAHYSEKHHGLCLGFEINPIDDHFYILNVQYDRELKSRKYFETGNDDLAIHWTTVKSQIWKYEEEVRAVNTEFNGLLSFDKRCLKEVIFGIRISSKERQLIHHILIKNNYPIDIIFKSMKINYDTFDIEEE
jgi:hypothetical protein